MLLTLPDEGVWGSYSATSIPVGLGVGTWIDRDVAAAQVVRNRGVSAVGQMVDENACGRDAPGAESLSLGSTGRNRKILEAILGSPSHNL